MRLNLKSRSSKGIFIFCVGLLVVITFFSIRYVAGFYDEQTLVFSSKDLPYSDLLKSDRGWERWSGKISVENDSLILQSDSGKKWAIGSLQGTNLWKDYIYTASIDWEKGSDIRILSRIQDKSNFAWCDFRNDTISVGQTIKGIPYVLKSVANHINFIYPNIYLGISVEGSAISCYGGTRLAVSSDKLDQGLDHGGIGIGIFNDNNFPTLARLNSVSIFTMDSFQDAMDAMPIYDLGTTYKPEPIQSIPITRPAATTTAKKYLAPPIPLYDTSGNPTPYIFRAANLFLSSSSPSIDPWKVSFGVSSASNTSSQIIFGKSFPFVPLVYIAASPSSTGGAILIGGGEGWQNYTVTANIDWIRGTSVGLLARYADSNNYVMCSYANRGQYVYLYEEIDGAQRFFTESYNLIAASYPYILPYGSIGMKVSGNLVSCFRDGKEVAHDTIVNMSVQGTVGFKIYGAMRGDALIGIEDVKVAPVVSQ